MFNTFVKSNPISEEKPHVYDCFNFFNEFDLLDIRLNELDGVVDYFVICESNVTHNGIPKPMYFKENEERFSKFKDKIIYLPMIVPEGTDVDHAQKSYVINALKNCKDSDIIIYSDLDEIPKSVKFDEAISKLPEHNLVCFAGKNCMYRLNGVKYNEDELDIWYGSVMYTYGWIKTRQIWAVRRTRIQTAYILEDAGWHFSSIGDLEHILTKFRYWGHANDLGRTFNTCANPKGLLEDYIEKGIDCFKPTRKVVYESIDFLPKYIQENKERFSYIIK